MARISVKRTISVDKTVTDITNDHILFTKNEDAIIMRLDPNLCTEFEDREAFMRKLYDYLINNKDIIKKIMND